MNIVNFLSGKKTYLTGAFALILVFGSWQHWWTIPEKIYEALMALALIFLRAGVAKRPTTPDPDLTPASAAKRAKGPPLMMLALACVPLAAAFTIVFAGCSTTAQQSAYRGAGTTAIGVDTAMKLWGTYVAESHPPVSQEQAVAAAYKKYQAAMASVCDAGEVYAVATTNTNSVYGTPTSASLALQGAIANANQEILDLENLIASFGVKLQPTTTTTTTP